MSYLLAKTDIASMSVNCVKKFKVLGPHNSRIQVYFAISCIKLCKGRFTLNVSLLDHQVSAGGIMAGSMTLKGVKK